VKTVLLVTYSHDGSWGYVIDVLALLVLGGWLVSSAMSGELRFRGSSTKRDEDPEMFWLGWGLLLLLTVAALLSLVGVLPKF